MTTPKRPSPIRLRGLSYSVVRGPNADGDWYWRARDAEERTVWTGWSSRAALLQSAPGEVPEPAPFQTVNHLMTQWMASRERDPQLKPQTLVCYATRAKSVQTAIGEESLTDLGPALMERLRDRLIAMGLTQRGVNARQRLLRSAARWAAEEERLKHRPLPVIRPRTADHVNCDYTPTEAEALTALRAMSGETALAATILAITGARVSEVAYLKRRDVDLQRGWLHLQGKTGAGTPPAAEEFERLDAAFSVLRDPASRADYDRTLQSAPARKRRFTTMRRRPWGVNRGTPARRQAWASWSRTASSGTPICQRKSGASVSPELTASAAPSAREPKSARSSPMSGKRRAPVLP